MAVTIKDTNFSSSDINTIVLKENINDNAFKVPGVNFEWTENVGSNFILQDPGTIWELLESTPTVTINFGI